MIPKLYLDTQKRKIKTSKPIQAILTPLQAFLSGTRGRQSRDVSVTLGVCGARECRLSRQSASRQKKIENQGQGPALGVSFKVYLS